MKEIFYEESAELRDRKSAGRKYYTFKILSVLSYVLLVFWVILVFVGYDIGQGYWLTNLIFILVPIVVFLLSGIFLGRVKNRFYLDYDYTFVTGSVRIAKVIKNSKRRSIIKFEAENIERIGKYDSATYNKYAKMPGISKLILTGNYTPAEGKDFYYIAVNADGSKKLLVLECTETLIVNILKFSNKNVLEEDFK